MTPPHGTPNPPPDPPRGAGAGARELWVWVAGTGVGCLLVLLAAGRTWVTVKGAGVVAPTGGDLSPALTPIGLAGLAGVVAVLATRGVGRRIVGALLALCGVGAAASAWTAAGRVTVLEWLRGHNAVQAASGIDWEPVTFWPVVAVAGGVLMAVGGIVAVVRGGRWVGMSARYQRPDGAAPKADDRSMWDALDRGDDPTDSR
ncbi:Trp biosynthesis-associated membrane protein [Nonomuraea sp. NPDC050536]|uniref:Trp biosynthesis-associated membrane protein n=1 Tax=Nonomuraea sp. NPDC050536 TaxID=3364366 RepID=UPI0037C5ADA2